MSGGIGEFFKSEIRWKSQRLAERAARSGCRQWLNRNPAVVVGICCLSAVVLGLVVAWFTRPEAKQKAVSFEKEWYYDLNTGELFTAPAGLAGPIEAPSGPLPNGHPAGVKAYVLSYAEQPNEAERFIGFLQKPDPNGKGDRALLTSSAAALWKQGKLVKKVEDRIWVPAGTPQGRAIIEKAMAPNENGEPPYYVQPP